MKDSTHISNDCVKFEGAVINHISAGGFLFYERPSDHELFVALIKDQYGNFTIPKGHKKTHEKLVDTASREIKEELGIEQNLLPIKRVCSTKYLFEQNNRTNRKTVHIFLFSLNNKILLRPNSSEGIVKARWFKFNVAKNAIFKPYKNILLDARVVYYQNKPYSNKPVSVSIGIPTHNGSATLLDALQSIKKSIIFSSMQANCEIILCLDHCTDNTEPIAMKLKKDLYNSNIKMRIVRNSGEKGKSTVMNELFKYMKNDLIIFFDDDVIVNQPCIKEILSFFQKSKFRLCSGRWVRKKPTSGNRWNRFWENVFGIKFDLNPESHFVRGRCISIRKNDYVKLSDNIFNDDQFLQYVYWPDTAEILNAIIFFNSTRNFRDYYKRYIRITTGIEQLKDEFSEYRVKQCKSEISYSKKPPIKGTSKQKIIYTIYKIIKFYVSIMVNTGFLKNDKNEYFRYRQKT